MPQVRHEPLAFRSHVNKSHFLSELSFCVHMCLCLCVGSGRLGGCVFFMGALARLLARLCPVISFMSGHVDSLAL